MPSTEILAAFLVTTGLFAFIPGPAMLYVAARTVAGGRRAGLLAVLGIQAGGYAHVVAAAAGLSVLSHAVPTLYLAVKLAGAAYLVWLGIGLIRAKAATNDGGDIALPPARSGRRAFLSSVAVEVLNPKTALFFVAFLPQFVDPAAGAPIWLQLLVLGTIVNLMFSLADLAAVLFAEAMAARLRRSGRAQRWMSRIGGSVLVGLGAHLALQRS